MSITSNTLLSGIPSGLREPLIDEYNKLLKNFRENRWEPAGLNGGRFAEIVYTILKGHVDGSFPASPSKPSNMVDACRHLENTPSSSFPRSVRIQIPRVLLALYEIRNNRNIGHVGGGVDPNHMDSAVVIGMVKWTFGELVRIFHNVSPAEAQDAIEAITTRESPLIWETQGTKRVLNPKISKPNQTLILLHSCAGSVNESDLFDWVEHSNKSVFRRDVLVKLHKRRLIEYDRDSGKVEISPTGIEFVEEKLLTE